MSTTWTMRRQKYKQRNCVYRGMHFPVKMHTSLYQFLYTFCQQACRRGSMHMPSTTPRPFHILQTPPVNPGLQT